MFIHPAWRSIFRPSAPKVTLTDLREDISNLTVYTFSGCNISYGAGGTLSSESSDNVIAGANGSYPRASSRSIIIVTIHAEDAALTFGISGVTLGGVAGSEEADRGGGTSAINSGLYWWRTADIVNITNTDIVVTMTEAVTGCAIGVLRIDNIGTAQKSGTNSGNVGTGEISQSVNQNQAAVSSNHGLFGILVSTCATGGGTERFQVDHIIGSDTTHRNGMGLLMLYEGSNAEFDYGAAFVYLPQYVSSEVTAPLFIGAQWSGAGAGDAIMSSWQ